jgi:hypothetical protein
MLINGPNAFCFLSSLSFLSQPPRQCLALTYMSPLYSKLTLYRGCGLPIHMIGEVSEGVKKMTNVGLLVYYSSMPLIVILPGPG